MERNDGGGGQGVRALALRRVGAAAAAWLLVVAGCGREAEDSPFKASVGPAVPPYLDEATAKLEFGERVGFRYDPWALLVPKARMYTEVEWKDHPNGRWVLQTNNLGFVGAHPTGPKRAARRVLVSGDSHTQGALPPDKTFVALAEDLLVRAGHDVELLNAGTAFTSPRAYYGRLLRCLPLEIDDYVAVIFTGNDFWEEFSIATLRETGRLADNVGRDYGTRLKAAIAHNRNPMFQGLNQAFRFKYRPEEAERALSEVQHSLLDMRDLCAWKGIRLRVLVLPTKQVVEPELDAELFDALCEILDVTYDEARSERVLAERLMEWMDVAGIAYVDLLPPLQRARGDEELYWARDYHIGRAGHRVVAEVLRDVLMEGAESAPAASSQRPSSSSESR